MSEQNNQNIQESQTPHKRRVRYKGKYPKKFEEKYKELQPEKVRGTSMQQMLTRKSLRRQENVWQIRDSEKTF